MTKLCIMCLEEILEYQSDLPMISLMGCPVRLYVNIFARDDAVYKSDIALVRSQDTQAQNRVPSGLAYRQTPYNLTSYQGVQGDTIQ